MSITRKELYSGSMVIFIAVFYLLSTGAQLFDASGNHFKWAEWKMLLLSAFYLVSGILFFMKRNAGWMMTSGVLLNFVLVMIVFLFEMSQVSVFNSAAAMAIFLFFLLLLALLFLFSRQTRKKYAVNNKSYLGMIAVYLLLMFLNYFLDK